MIINDIKWFSEGEGTLDIMVAILDLWWEQKGIIFLIMLMSSVCLKTCVEAPRHFLNCKTEKLGYTLFFRKIA